MPWGRPLSLLLAAGFLAASAHARAADNSFAIRDVRLFDGARRIERTTVVVREGRIETIGRRARIPAGMKSIDGSGRTLLPGLVDAHVHVFPGAQADALRFGVTAELDMFNLTHEFARWRAQRESLARTVEADSWTAGTGVSAPGGHPSGTMPGSQGIPTLATASEAAGFVAARVAEGSDYVKIILEDNSFLAPGHPIPALTRESVCAAVAAAHALRKLAIVHAGRMRDARIAIECGADGLAHLFSDEVADPAFIALARSRRIFVVTTLSVVAAGSGLALTGDLYSEPAMALRLSEGQKRFLAAGFFGPVRPRGIEAALRSALLLHRAGVPLLAGSDAPNPGAPHGAGMHAELRLLARAGLPPMDALRAATSVPARVFGLPGRGCIARGCRADLLLVRGDPTRDIAATSAIERVWKNGFEVDGKAPAPTP
jgi:imidazolonepropionase-like amidohydrolase